MSRRWIILAAAALCALPSAGRAQSGGSGFLFHQPHASLTIRTGWAVASARSDLFAFTTDQLTIDRADFSAPAFDAEYTLRVWSRTEAVIALSVASAKHRSEFRDFIDNNDMPIEQSTSFIRVPVTIGFKQYLTPTGRFVGKFAWIPAKAAPYVGASGGAMYYRFRQSGDFIDFRTSEVFASQMTSGGWTPTATARGGIDYSLSARLALSVEGRYTWADADLSEDFSGFERLDLSGFATTAGLKIRF